MSGKATPASYGARGARLWVCDQFEMRRSRKHELMLATPPPDWREYFDHYLGRRARLVDFQHALLSLQQFFPCHLVFALRSASIPSARASCRHSCPATCRFSSRRCSCSASCGAACLRQLKHLPRCPPAVFISPAPDDEESLD